MQSLPNWQRMNLNKFFTYIYLVTFSLMFFLLGASELRESADFIFFGASRDALIVSSFNEGLMDFPDSERTSRAVLARLGSEDTTEVKAISKALFTYLKPGATISVYELGKRRYVKINSFMSLYAKALFYFLVAAASGMACAWSLKSPVPRVLKRKRRLFSATYSPTMPELSNDLNPTSQSLSEGIVRARTS